MSPQQKVEMLELEITGLDTELTQKRMVHQAVTERIDELEGYRADVQELLDQAKEELCSAD